MGPRAKPGRRTLLERGFPFAEVSTIIDADRRSRDPRYSMHRWWARRPPALVRAALLAATLDDDTSPTEFWAKYGTDAPWLENLTVFDPFMGGGSTLVEAQRLGGRAIGTDVDPLALEIVRGETTTGNSDEFRKTGEALVTHLAQRFSDLYPCSPGREPLHYFMLPQVTCTSCGEPSLLYRDLVLARDTGRVGAVVRDQKLIAFWPDDLSIHVLAHSDRTHLTHQGERRNLYAGTYVGQAFRCPSCGARCTHRQLLTGAADLRLLAVEDTVDGGRRDIREPENAERTALELAARRLSVAGEEAGITQAVLSTTRRDPRPLSYGIDTIADLHTARQALVLGAAFAWISSLDHQDPSKSLLRLAVSNAVATNNRLCSYARDYGRLSGLFSIRGYAIPALVVELNPLHPSGGRGTLKACIERVARAVSTGPRRAVWDPQTRQSTAVQFTHEIGAPAQITCQEAEKPLPPEFLQPDIAFFDPPYYDYIAYDELSEIYRGWLGLADLGGQPLLPDNTLHPPESFGLRLGAALRAVLDATTPGRPVAFTYHAATKPAWDAVGIALDDAKLSVTALWPVRTDGHMGHHGHTGNCEWDLLIVARPVEDTTTVEPTFGFQSWRDAVKPMTIGDADRQSMQYALEMVRSRFGLITTGGSPEC